MIVTTGGLLVRRDSSSSSKAIPASRADSLQNGNVRDIIIIHANHQKVLQDTYSSSDISSLSSSDPINKPKPSTTALIVAGSRD
jgi:hypothetical protein